MKKNNKAFTLIELLAIIVILAIIAVITVPIILNIIDNAKIGSVQDSAYGYKDAINKYYVSKLADDSHFEFDDGTYTKEQLKNMGVSISGQEPHSNSWVEISDNAVINGCIQYDEYKVEITNEKVGTAQKGECGAPAVATQYLYITDELYVYPDLYVGGEWDSSIGNYAKTQKIGLSNGSMTRPDDANVYLKYALTNEEVADGTLSEVCIFSDTYGGELCVKKNEFEISAQKIKDYFGYDESTWTNVGGNQWKNPSQTTSCRISDSYVDCSGSGVSVYANKSSGQVGSQNSSRFCCYTDNVNDFCYWD